MDELKISPDFTIDDIHKVREYNYEKTKDMTPEEHRAYYREAAVELQKRIDAIRAARGEGTNCTWM